MHGVVARSTFGSKKWQSTSGSESVVEWSGVDLCMYLCMYVCMYVCMFLFHKQNISCHYDPKLNHTWLLGDNSHLFSSIYHESRTLNIVHSSPKNQKQNVLSCSNKLPLNDMFPCPNVPKDLHVISYNVLIF